LKTKEIDHSGI